MLNLHLKSESILVASKSQVNFKLIIYGIKGYKNLIATISWKSYEKTPYASKVATIIGISVLYLSAEKSISLKY